MTRSALFSGVAEREEPTPPGAPGPGDRRRLALVLVAGTVLTAVELVAGLVARSLVLLADAAHYFTDLAAVSLALAASAWALRPADARHSFGHARGGILAAFLNAILLWGIVALLVVEAYLRLRAPVGVDAPIVIAVGAGTLGANVGLAWFLRRGAAGNLNVRAASLHLLSDGAGSAAAVAAGVVIYVWGFALADPLATLAVAALIAVFALRLSRETANILMEGTPPGLDPAEVERSIRELPRVRSVHDLHLWTVGSGSDTMSVHVVLDAPPADDRVIHAVQELVRRRFRIRHATVQVEAPDCPCGIAAH